MADIFHLIGDDLQISSNGNFVIAYDEVVGQQRVLRRLLTNAGDYPWELAYGAGLAKFIGLPMSKPQITATIFSQMALERAVMQVPPPTIDVSATADGIVTANIQYIDRDTQQVSVLDFTTDG